MIKKLILILTLITFSMTDLGAQQFKALLFTKTAGYRHASIHEGVSAIKYLGEKHFFDVFWTEDANVFNEEKLKQYAVVIFLNNDDDILNEQQQAAFENYIQQGGGYVGIHGASASEQNWEWFGKLTGRFFITHPRVQTAIMTVENHNHPSTAHLPKKWLWTDEWYEFTEAKTDKMKVLITVNENTYNAKTKNTDGMGDFHPIAWFQEFDGGRSFYTGLGHIGAAFKDPWFLQHIYGGIYWAATGNMLE